MSCLVDPRKCVHWTHSADTISSNTGRLATALLLTTQCTTEIHTVKQYLQVAMHVCMLLSCMHGQ